MYKTAMFILPDFSIMKKALVLIFIILFLKYSHGQNINIAGTYYKKTQFYGTYLTLELKSDSTYVYNWITDWGGKLDKGRWTINKDIIKLISNDTINNPTIEYQLFGQINKDKIKEPISKENWAFLIKSKVKYGKNNNVKKRTPKIKKGPYLKEINRKND